MEKAIPFSYCLGISAFSVPWKLLENDKQRFTGNSAFTGLLFGNKGKAEICVKSLIMSCKKWTQTWKKTSIFLKKFCLENKTEFLGFYSYGQMPNEKDIHNLENAMRIMKSSLFLLKFDHLNEDADLTLFECVFDNSCIGIEKILILQAHSTPECGGLVTEIKQTNGNITKKAKVFYIGFKFSIYDQLTRLDRLDLPEAQKDKMFDDRIKIHPNYAEHHMTLYQAAVAGGVTSLVQSFLDYNTVKKEPDFDCIKTLKDLCQKGKVDVTFNFEVLLNCSGNEKVCCFIKILDDYITTGFEDSLKTSCLSSTCAVLIDFCIERSSV